MSLDQTLSRVDETLDAAVARLCDFLRIPSISTDPAFVNDCKAAADWLVQDLQSLGADARAIETPGHPMVVGHMDGPSGSPHLLFYGHYDVQPVDPLNLWDADPFDPQIIGSGEDRIIRARGAADDKGQLMTFVEACRTWIAQNGALPCKITFMFEGEEESGSPSLQPFMRDFADELRADIALICDTGLYNHDTPAITTMLRGLVSEEITIHAANKDLHSGLFGGLAMNPIRVLTQILADLHDDQGRVTLPGFYDGIPDLPADQRAAWDALNFDAGAFLGAVGLSQPAGEAGRLPLEMLWSRPTCDVNGVWGGYTGAGFKTVLPAEAHAKVSFRLVDGQDPDQVHQAFMDHVTSRLPADCRVEFGKSKGSPACVMQTSDPKFDAARAALSAEWPKPAQYIGIGGSIPIAGYFKTILDMDAMLIGFGKEDDQIHSPNEKYDLRSFHKGIRSWVRILDALSGGSK